MPLVRSRSGFTLVELMIVLVMLGLVGAITVKVLTGTQRVTVAQGERALMQSTTRTGVLVLPSELREINPALGDITAMSATSITYRSMRTLAVSCSAPTTASVLVETADIRGVAAQFAVGDSVLIFADGADTDWTGDDGWAMASISSVATGTACSNGEPGTTLGLTSGLMPDGSTPVLGPMTVVRGFQETTLASYVGTDGKTWLGMLGPDDDEGIQPVLGPLAADSGLTLRYRDNTGAETTTMTAVEAIDVKVIGVTSRPVHNGQQTPAVEYDSLTTRIALRNTF